MKTPKQPLLAALSCAVAIAASAATFLSWQKRGLAQKLKQVMRINAQLDLLDRFEADPNVYGYIEYAILSEQLKQTGADEAEVGNAARISEAFCAQIDPADLALLPRCFEKYLLDQCSRKFGCLTCTTCGERGACEKYLSLAAHQRLEMKHDTACSTYAHNREGCRHVHSLYRDLASSISHQYGTRIDFLRKCIDAVFDDLNTKAAASRTAGSKNSMIEAYLQARDRT